MSPCLHAREADVPCRRAQDGDRRQPPVSGSAPTPNRAFHSARRQKGWGRGALAARVREWARAEDPDSEPPSQDSVLKCIGRVERGEVLSPGDFYAPAFAAVLGVSTTELFGTDQPAVSSGTGFTVTAHQFVPVFVGAEAVQRLATEERFASVDFGWTMGWTTPLDGGGASASAYLLEWGVVVLHLSRQLHFLNVAALAAWRAESHAKILAENDAGELLAEATGRDWGRSPEYVLTTFWVDDPVWEQAHVGTATHLLCVPSVLLDRHAGEGDELLARAEVAERAHLRSGFRHPEVVEFGVPGVAVGCASWSGVVYLPVAPSRALRADELVSFEVVVQGLWCYCAHIRAAADSVERAVPARYGWRFLRNCRSQLTTAAPTETGQVRMMRDAVLRTSRLTELLDDAQAMLRDPD